MLRPRLARLLAIVGVVLATHMYVGVPGTGSPARAAEPGDERCAALRAEGLRVVLADPAETAYCLVDVPDLDTRYVQLLNVADASGFPARKAETADALRAAGVDLCRITLWWVRRDAVRARVPATAWYASPATCPPRVTAHDAGAARWADTVAGIVRDAVEEDARTYGVPAILPLTVHLYGDRDAYLARVTADQGEAAARARLSGTEGVTVRGPIEGVWIALDTSRFSPAQPEQTAFVIRHEVAHYVQTVAAGCACAFPAWFAEGMADYAAARATGPAVSRRSDARAAKQEGRARPLRDLTVYPAGDEMAVYDRGDAAVDYLAERWGADVIVDLLHSAVDGDPAAFDGTLTALTGLSVDDLDRAVGRWLIAP
jgi:hypothetical protein